MRLSASTNLSVCSFVSIVFLDFFSKCIFLPVFGVSSHNIESSADSKSEERRLFGVRDRDAAEYQQPYVIVMRNDDSCGIYGSTIED